MIVNEECLGFGPKQLKMDNRSHLETSFWALGKNDEHFSQFL